MKRPRILIYGVILLATLMCTAVALWLFTEGREVEARKLGGVIGIAVLWLTITADDL